MNNMDNLAEHIAGLQNSLFKLIEQMKPYADGSMKREKEDQLRAVEKSIGAIKSKGLDIPHELRSLKLNLLAEIDKINDSTNKFDELVSYLKEVLATKLPKKYEKYRPKKEIPFETETNKTDTVDPKSVSIHQDKIQLSLKKLKEASFQSYFLSQLINNGILKGNTVISRRLNNKTHEGVITRDGKVQINEGGKSILFDTIHAAAKFINPDCLDGLNFWRVQHPEFDVLITLSTYLKGKVE